MSVRERERGEMRPTTPTLTLPPPVLVLCCVLGPRQDLPKILQQSSSKRTAALQLSEPLKESPHHLDTMEREVGRGDVCGE